MVNHIMAYKHLAYKFLILITLNLFPNFLVGQIYDPVEWKTSVEQISENEFDLVVLAKIQSGWHVYGQKIAEGGPVPTKFSYVPHTGYKLKGETLESKGQDVFDVVFEMEMTYFEGQAEFRQKIIRTSPELAEIEAQVEFMVCNDEQCLPPEVEPLFFKFPKTINRLDKEYSSKQRKNGLRNGVPDDKEELTGENHTDQKRVKEEDISAISNTESGIPSTSPLSNINEKSASVPKEIDKNSPVKPKSIVHPEIPRDKGDSKGLWGIFIIAFLSGFAALLTPCVFPMIPLTVSFFTKQSKNRANGIKNAVLYGVSIIVIYLLLGSLVTLIFGADALNALSTNVWFNLIFFLILVIFAVSFLGAFEITLPNSWGNKVDSQADKGGIIGIFFMALALAIVSFSCTGPIVGTLLVQAAAKGGIAPLVGMLGFSSAIAIPFALFAAFPGWMNSLPKSGGWLNTVKVTLGFLELALAFKFLSNADLVLQLHLLERETFLVIWIAIFGVLALYLLGKIRLAHDTPLPYISVGRLSLGLLVLAFTIYMIPGLWGAPLQWISGFPPPRHYSESPFGVGNSKGTEVSENLELEEGMELGPLEIPIFKDYEKGMAYAKKVNKPILLDFTGYACVNCRKMEERVWPDPRVEESLRNDLVLVSLYVDDKKELPENEQYVSETSGKNIETVGNKWSDFQIKYYKTNAQPYYVLLDNNGTMLNAPTAYDPDIESYANWLKEGIRNYNNQ